MSSSAEDEKHNAKTKTRTINRACDACRRKKVRCDGPTTESNVCSNCTQYNNKCTYVEAAKKRGPPKGYVEALETRLSKMEGLLKTLCPDADFTRELGSHVDSTTWYTNEKNRRDSGRPTDAEKPGQHFPPTKQSSLEQMQMNDSRTEELCVSDEDLSPQVVEDDFRQRMVGPSGGHLHVDVTQTTTDTKRESASDDLTFPYLMPYRTNSAVESDLVSHEQPIQFEFPPSDLMEDLISHYFHCINLYLPLLHRQTLERQYRDGLHRRDTGFASVLLLVCAVAARSFHDARVLRDDGKKDQDFQNSAGWKYYDQLKMGRKLLTTSPVTLYDLQQYTLAAIFLREATIPYAGWVMIGTGLRTAQDVGAHRKRNNGEHTAVEHELWKRVFWILVNLDRIASSTLGRPCAIHDEDFDIELPLEVDDEYWESSNPEESFKQPAHLPSTVAYFRASIRLDQILSFTLRTIYSVDKTKMRAGSMGKQWEQHTVTQLHSMLSSWLDSLPEHLNWSMAQENAVFFEQSSLLYATYYHIQILVHRPFIPSPGKPQKVSYPSLTICTDAARAMSFVLDGLCKRCGTGPSPALINYAFMSGLVLLLDIWGMTKAGDVSVETSEFMQNVHMCMKYLSVAHPRWPLAGKLKDMLCDLASMGEIPLTRSHRHNDNKRKSDSDRPKSPEPVAGLHLRSHAPEQRDLRQLNIPHADFSLPLNPPDLQRVPPHCNFYPQQEGPPVSTHSELAVSSSSWCPDPQPFPHPGTSYSGSIYESSEPVMFVPISGAGNVLQTVAMPTTPSYPNDFGTSVPHHLFPGQEQSGLEYAYQCEGTLDMWSTAPTGFLLEDWGDFTANIPNVQISNRSSEMRPAT